VFPKDNLQKSYRGEKQVTLKGGVRASRLRLADARGNWLSFHAVMAGRCGGGNVKISAHICLSLCLVGKKRHCRM